MKRIILSLAVLSSVVAMPAYAWGDREQGILAGAAGLWAIQQINRAGQVNQPVVVQQPPVVYQPQPVIVQPVPAGCFQQMVDINGRPVLVQIPCPR